MRIAICSFLVLFAGSHVARSSEAPTPEGLLTEFQSAIDKLTRVRIEYVEERSREQRPSEIKEDTPSKKATEKNTRTILRDGAKWHVTNDIMVEGVDGIPDGFSRRIDAIFSDQIWILNKSERGLVFSAWLEPHRASQEARETGRPDAKRQLANVLGGAMTLFGRLHGDGSQTILEVMREAAILEVKPETELVGSAETYVLRSRGKYGEHTLWIDRKCGGLPRKIEVLKQPGHLHDEVQVGALAGQSGESAPITITAPNGIKSRSRTPDIRRFALTIDKVELEDRSGVFVMTRWNTEESTTMGNAKTEQRMSSENTVSVFEFLAKDAARQSFQLDGVVPNGTRVNVMDGAPGARYEWMDGKIKPRSGN